MTDLPAVTIDTFASVASATPAPPYRFLALEPGETLRLHPALAEEHKRVDRYKPAEGLKEAIDVAMMLGVPLLITGEPGTGKTSAADWLARTLGAGAVLPLDIKSGTAGRDLLYTFDEVARFRDSSRPHLADGGSMLQLSKPVTAGRTGAADESGRSRDGFIDDFTRSREGELPLINYLRLSALGEAIVRAAGGAAVLQTPDKRPLEGEWFARNREVIRRAFGERAAGADAAHASWLLPMEPEFARAPGEHRIVLIDEMDKAPRDTPNDLLAEINDMAFAIPELGLRVEAAGGLRPIVLITSNSEKALPEPFLRRCAYFNIPETTREQLREILIGTIPKLAGGILVESALDLFRDVRRHPRVQKRPGTAELLAWLDVIHRQPMITADMTVAEACRSYLALLAETSARAEDARSALQPPPNARLASAETAHALAPIPDAVPAPKPAPVPASATARRPHWPLLGALMKSDDDIEIAMGLLVP